MEPHPSDPAPPAGGADPAGQPSRGALARHARVLVDRPGTVLLVTMAVLLPLLWASVRFQVESGADAMLEGDQRTRDAYALVEDALREQVVVVVSMHCERVFDRVNLLLMERLSHTLLHQPGVEDVKSFTHSTIPVRRGLGFDMEPFLGGPVAELSDEQLAERETFSRTHPLVRNLMLSADGRHATIGVTYEPGFFGLDHGFDDAPAPASAADQSPEVDIDAWRHQIDAILDQHRIEGVEFTWISLPSAQEELVGLFSTDLRRFAILLGFVLALWLVGFFRTWRLLLYGIGSVLLFAPVIPGVLGLLQIQPGVFTLAVFPLLGAILLTMLAHVTHAFRSALGRGLEPPEAAWRALCQISRSTTLAAVTTAIGMASFALSGLSQAREFGWLGTSGVLLALVIVLGPGTSLLVLLHRGLKAPVSIANPGAVRLPEPWRRPLLAALTVLLLLAAAGWWQRSTDVRITGLLPESSRTRLAAENLQQAYDGIQFLKIGIDSGVDGGISQRPFLEYLLELEKHAERLPGVSATYSYAAVMAMMNQVWNGWQPDTYHLPDGQWLLTVFDLALANAGFPFTHALHDDERRTAWLYVRLRDMPARETAALVRDLEQRALEDAPPGVDPRLEDGLHNYIEAEARIERAQWWTIGATLLAAGAFLALWWRSLSLAMVAIAFVAIPTMAALGLAGWFGVPLNSITFMVAAIVLGIGLDDVVHWLGYWKELRTRGLGPAEAIQRTRQVKGHPILLTSVLLVAVFLAFGIMRFPPLVHFGWTAAVALAAAVALLLIGLPWWLGRQIHAVAPNPSKPTNVPQFS